MLTKICRIRGEDSGQEEHSGTLSTIRRTVPCAGVSPQAGLPSPALMLIVPVDGLDTKVKQVLQPVGQTAKSSRMENRTFCRSQESCRKFLAKISLIRHLRIRRRSLNALSYTEPT